MAPYSCQEPISKCLHFHGGRSLCSSLQLSARAKSSKCDFLYYIIKENFKVKCTFPSSGGSLLNPSPPPIAGLPPWHLSKKLKHRTVCDIIILKRFFFRYLIPVPYYNATVRHLFNTRPPPSAPIKNSKHCTDMEPLSPNICIPP